MTRWRQPKRGPRACRWPRAAQLFAATVAAAAVTAAAGRVGLRRVPRDPGGGGGPAVRPLAVPRLRPTLPTRRARGPTLPRPRSGLGPPSGPRRLAGRRGGAGRARPPRPTERCRPRRDGARPPRRAQAGAGVSAPRPRSRVELSLLPLGSGARPPRPGLACLGWRVPGPARAGVKSSRGVGTGLCPFSLCF